MSEELEDTEKKGDRIVNVILWCAVAFFLVWVFSAGE